MRTITKRKLKRPARKKRQKINLVYLRHRKDLWKELVTVPAQLREGPGAGGCSSTEENLSKPAIEEEEDDRGCVEPAEKSWFCKSRGSTTRRRTGNVFNLWALPDLAVQSLWHLGLDSGFHGPHHLLPKRSPPEPHSQVLWTVTPLSMDRTWPQAESSQENSVNHSACINASGEQMLWNDATAVTRLFVLKHC